MASNTDEAVGRATKRARRAAVALDASARELRALDEPDASVYEAEAEAERLAALVAEQTAPPAPTLKQA